MNNFVKFIGRVGLGGLAGYFVTDYLMLKSSEKKYSKLLEDWKSQTYTLIEIAEQQHDMINELIDRLKK